MNKNTKVGFPVFKTYTKDEIPDNIQQVDIVEAQQIIDNIPVKADPQKIKVSRATQTIKLNLSISIPNNNEIEV